MTSRGIYRVLDPIARVPACIPEPLAEPCRTVPTAPRSTDHARAPTCRSNGLSPVPRAITPGPPSSPVSVAHVTAQTRLRPIARAAPTRPWLTIVALCIPHQKGQLSAGQILLSHQQVIHANQRAKIGGFPISPQSVLIRNEQPKFEISIWLRIMPFTCCHINNPA